MTRVVRMDTMEEIGYFVDLYGPLEPGTGGWSFEAWTYPDGSFHTEPPPASAGSPLTPRWKIWMPVEHSRRDRLRAPGDADLSRFHGRAPGISSAPAAPDRAINSARLGRVNGEQDVYKW